jgi:hypothetical protein
MLAVAIAVCILLVNAQKSGALLWAGGFLTMAAFGGKGKEK